MQKRLFEISETIYFFIDEIQNVDFWQDIIKRYYDINKTMKFIISASQSIKLQGKSKESLAGRLIEYKADILFIREYLNISAFHGNYQTIWDCRLNQQGFNELYDYYYKHQLHLEKVLPKYLCYGRAYVQFRGSEFHTRNARSWQLQEQRRAKAQR